MLCQLEFLMLLIKLHEVFTLLLELRDLGLLLADDPLQLPMFVDKELALRGTFQQLYTEFR